MDAPADSVVDEAADHAADPDRVNGTHAAGAPEEEEEEKADEDDPAGPAPSATGSEAAVSDPAEDPSDSTSEHLSAPSGAEPR